jgi:sigma-B regulation protein RsbU (phosphoserine phosphatase)
MMRAATTPAVPYRYYWNHPDDTNNYGYLKQAYVRYFEPLDWYVVASVYLDELRAPARAIVKKQILLTSIVFLFAIACTYVLVNRVSKPLNQLTAYARHVVERDFTNSNSIASSIDEIGRSIRDEVGRLAATFAYMIRALQEYIDKLTETTAARERIESELRVAHDIQMSMLPKIVPSFRERPEFDIYATMTPAREVGGDFYDFFFIDDKHFCLAIGDVSGKGVPASLFMAVSKSLIRLTTALIRALTAQGSSPDEVLRRVNTELERENEQCMFVTIFLAIVELESGQVEYSNAGHNPPFLISADGGLRALDDLRAPPVGVKADAPYGRSPLRLLPGDVLFMYTDGITEAENPEGSFFSENRLKECLTRNEGKSLEERAHRIVQEVANFRASSPQSDDMTLLVFRYLGGH